MAGKPQPESIKHLEAYRAYLRQPTPRNIRKLAQEIKVPWRTLFGWRSRYQWRERALAYDRRLIDAAAAEREEEQATVRVVHNFYQACKFNMADFATTVKKRHERGEPVTANEAHTTMRILEMLERNYATILQQAAEPELLA